MTPEMLEKKTRRHAAAAGNAEALSARPSDPLRFEMRYRLLGRVGEEDCAFPLAAGDNPVGGSPANAVALPLRGVSRRHALVRVAPEGVTVEDLGSKNGTLVNSRPVARSQVAAGDEIRFGPVALRLECVAADDAELGLALPGRGSRASEPPAYRDTTYRMTEGGLPLASWLRLAGEALTVLSSSRGGDLAGALALVVRRLELAGAALAEWSSEGEPVILASAGRVGGLPAGFAPAPPGLADRHFGLEEGPLPMAWVAAGSGRSRESLLLWGDFAGRARSEAFCDLLLRSFSGLRDRPLATLGETVPPAPPRLAFPAGYLPGEAPAMTALYRQLERIASGELPVLLVGETGVGKEPLARTLHASSLRRRGPFVAVNCAAIPAEMLEAEMFGIGRGVATGVTERAGRFQQAGGGTLFLDEIGDLPLPLQAKLLRALQEKEIQPVGRPAQPIDVRVVAATNRDLEQAVDIGGFRRDLYYRLAGLVLTIPPLRQRREDIPRLVGHFLAAACREAGKSVQGITVKALRLLADGPWPGNVRELEHAMRRLAYLCPEGQAIDSRLLPPGLLDAAGVAGIDADDLDLAAHTDVLARRLIRLALDRAGGNQSEAARLLGVSRNGLALRMRRLGIER